MAAKKSSVPKGTEFIKYHNDGTIWAKGQMLNELMEGYWEWYRKDGVIMRSGYFEKGEQVGEWITYDRNGEKLKVTNINPKPAKRTS